MIVYNCFCRFVVPLAVTAVVCGYEFDILIFILLSAADGWLYYTQVRFMTLSRNIILFSFTEHSI